MAKKDIPLGPIGFRLAHELEGLLLGIRADGIILPEETARVAGWLEASRAHTQIHPFREICKHLEPALSDGRLTTDEIDDLLFVVSKYTTVNPYFDQLRGGLQVLMGLLSGYASDAVLHAAEVKHLTQWLVDWGHLKGLWPFDECEAIVTYAINTRRIPDDAVEILALAQCVPVAGAPKTDLPPLTLAGICAIDPEIEFQGRQFVFTGDSARCERPEMESRVVKKFGVTHPTVTKAADYLVVCTEGSEHWAFSCYGRKVEKAFQMRQEGHRITIVHEVDFWDALVL